MPLYWSQYTANGFNWTFYLRKYVHKDSATFTYEDPQLRTVFILGRKSCQTGNFMFWALTQGHTDLVGWLQWIIRDFMTFLVSACSFINWVWLSLG